MTKTFLVLAAAVLLAAAPAAAHVTTTVDPVSAPLVVGQPTNVTVHFSEPCFEVLPQEAQGQDTVMAGLDPGAPATISWVGETVPFTTDMCDPSAVPFALVRATAILTIVPTVDAPGLTNLTLPVTSYLGGGSAPGENVSLAVTIAHFANGNLTAREASGHAAHGGNGTAIELKLTYTTNAESLLSIQATSSTGVVLEINATRVDPPSFDNKSQADVEVEATFVPPAEWDNATITFQAYLTPIVGGAKVPVGNATLTLANDGEHGEHDADGHEHDDEKGAPAPGLLFVGLALVAAVCARRR